MDPPRTFCFQRIHSEFHLTGIVFAGSQLCLFMGQNFYFLFVVIWQAGRQEEKTFLKKKILGACSLGKLCAETSMAPSDSSSSELIGGRPTTRQALSFDVETLRWSSALLTCICYLMPHNKELELICLTLRWLALKLFQVVLVTSCWQDLCSQTAQSNTVVFISEPHGILNWTRLSRNVCHII